MRIIKTFEGFMGDDDDIMIPTRDTDDMPMPGPAGKFDHEDQGGENYMFFGNLQTIKRAIDEMLKMDPSKVDAILRNGHDWASDHIATSKDDIEEVFNFLVNEMSNHGMANEGKSYMCKECNSSYMAEELNDDMTCESCGSKLEESAE